MSLEEEIAIVQFAQGVHSDVSLPDQFNQLDEDERRECLYRLYFILRRSKLVDFDIEQAITDSSLSATDTPCVLLKAHLSKPGLNSVASLSKIVNLPEEDSEKVYKLLLHVFKIAYQQRLEFDIGGSTTWWYWDLSSNEIVQGLLKRQQELMDETYTNPGFRSEFISLAKLWNDKKTMIAAGKQDAEPVVQTQFDFVTYDELMTVCVVGDKYSRGIMFLRNSLGNALSIQYGIDSEQANRLVLAVMERHIQETYNTGLF